MHKTYLGAVCSIILVPFMFVLSYYILFMMEYSSLNILNSYSEIYPSHDPQPGTYLNKSGNALIDFKIYVEDSSYDNDDNPYGKILLHMYTNMDNVTDVVSGLDTTKKPNNDYLIPIIQCPD